jgi:hypothetical protein
VDRREAPSEFQEKIEEAKREIRDIEQRCPNRQDGKWDHRAGIHRKRQGMTTTLPLRFEGGFPLPLAQLPRLWQQHPSRLLCLNCLNQTPNTSPAINPAAA